MLQSENSFFSLKLNSCCSSLQMNMFGEGFDSDIDCDVDEACSGSGSEVEECSDVDLQLSQYECQTVSDFINNDDKSKVCLC